MKTGTDRSGLMKVVCVEPMKTYDINEAADFLKVDRTTALERPASGEVPGAKIGRAWVFLESDLVEYLRDKVRRQSTATIVTKQSPSLVRLTITGESSYS